MVMKHVKLFENWAEEIEVLAHLDNDRLVMTHSYTAEDGTMIYNVYCKDVIDLITDNVNDVLDLGNEANYVLDMESFSDYDIWKGKEYEEIKIYQRSSRYKLKNFLGVPKTNFLFVYWSEVKSFKGLENQEMDLDLDANYIENFKYCPDILEKADFGSMPILSYYGMKIQYPQNSYYESTLAGRKCYINISQDERVPKTKMYLDIKFNAERFCEYDQYGNSMVYSASYG